MFDTDDSAADDMLTPTELLRLKRASLRHLLDLKQAGHSPRFCELTVCQRTDRILALPSPSVPRRGRPRRTSQ